MHHSETPIPGTISALALLTAAAAILAGAVIGGLYLLAQGARMLGLG